MLRGHDGKLYRELAIDASAQEDLRESDRRHAITEILFFASVGDVKRMHGLCLVHDISVSAHAKPMPASHSKHAAQLPGSFIRHPTYALSSPLASACEMDTRIGG